MLNSTEVIVLISSALSNFLTAQKHTLNLCSCSQRRSERHFAAPTRITKGLFTLTNFKVASSTSGMLQCALSVTRWLTPYSRRVSSGHTKATDTLRVTLHTARNHTYALISRLSDQQSEGQPDAQTYRFLPTIRKPHCSRSHPRESDIDQFGSHNWKRQFLTGFTHYSLSRIESCIVEKWIAEDHDGPVSTP